MKLTYKIVLAFVIIASALTVNAQDSLYIYKNGVVIDKHELAEVDSVVFYKAEVPEENTVTDIDGNVYNTVVIGTQTWMAENLKTTTYNDGTPIPIETNATTWSQLNSGAYCWYNNDENSFRAMNGALYNWYAVSTEKLCPSGCHVPTDAEWTILYDFLSNDEYSGAIGPELMATTGWAEGKNGTDKYGYSALPSGFRDQEGSFLYATGDGSYWWTNSYTNIEAAGYLIIDYWMLLDKGDFMKSSGLPIRCLKD